MSRLTASVGPKLVRRLRAHHQPHTRGLKSSWRRTRYAVGMNPRRSLFPRAVLLVLSIVLGLLAWRMQVSSTPTPPELENTGNIMVYTSDPKASVSLTIYPGSTGPR